MMQTDDRPIGLFDSGIGGLTVLKSLLKALPNETFVYLGDTARLPYGSKSASTIERYLKQNIEFLASRNVKAVVVACNSASTVLLGKNSEFNFPVYNVIEPGAATALRSTKSKRIGVLGTRATVAAKAYVKALHQLDRETLVFQQPCPLLVPLVEEGWDNDVLTNLVIGRYLGPVLQAGIDTLILGCTHYPALREGIAKVAGPNIELVDSADAIAGLIGSDLSNGRLRPAQSQGPLQVMATDVSPTFAEVAARLLAPYELPTLELVDLGAT